MSARVLWCYLWNFLNLTLTHLRVLRIHLLAGRPWIYIYNQLFHSSYHLETDVQAVIPGTIRIIAYTLPHAAVAFSTLCSNIGYVSFHLITPFIISNVSSTLRIYFDSFYGVNIILFVDCLIRFFFSRTLRFRFYLYLLPYKTIKYWRTGVHCEVGLLFDVFQYFCREFRDLTHSLPKWCVVRFKPQTLALVCETMFSYRPIYKF